MEDKLKANADLVVQQMSPTCGFPFGYDAASVKWLDGFIERQRARGLNDQKAKGLMNTLGSYLGEAVIHCYGGKWAQVDGSWCIRFDEKNAVFPFAKVSKQLANGEADSISRFFATIPLVFKLKPE